MIGNNGKSFQQVKNELLDIITSIYKNCIVSYAEFNNDNSNLRVVVTSLQSSSLDKNKYSLKIEGHFFLKDKTESFGWGYLTREYNKNYVQEGKSLNSNLIVDPTEDFSYEEQPQNPTYSLVMRKDFSYTDTYNADNNQFEISGFDVKLKQGDAYTPTLKKE